MKINVADERHIFNIHKWKNRDIEIKFNFARGKKKKSPNLYARKVILEKKKEQKPIIKRYSRKINEGHSCAVQLTTARQFSQNEHTYYTDRPWVLYFYSAATDVKCIYTPPCVWLFELISCTKFRVICFVLIPPARATE